jgi:hypothetical protein
LIRPESAISVNSTISIEAVARDPVIAPYVSWLCKLVPPLVLPASFVKLLVSAWVTGTAFALARLALQYARLRAHVERLAVPSADAQARLELALRRTGLRRNARFVISQEPGTPAVAGLIRPTIVLARSIIDDPDPAMIERVIVHEAAHLERYDDWVDLAVRIALAIAYFSPALWFARSRLELEREIACDDRVVRECGGGREYARLLVSTAGGIGRPIGLALSSQRLVLRVESILAVERNRSAGSAPGFVAAACAVLISWMFVSGTHVAVALESLAPSRPITSMGRIAILPLAPGEALFETPLMRAHDLAAFTAVLRQRLEASGEKVLSQNRVSRTARALGFDQTTPTLACVEAECAAKIGRAVSADTIVVGTEMHTMAILWQVDVRVIAVHSGRQVGQYKATNEGDGFSDLNSQEVVGACLIAIVRGTQPCPSDPEY